MTKPAFTRLPYIAVSFLFALIASSFAHDTPVQLAAPESIPEAWNVIEQSRANIDTLLQDNLMRDVAAQIANVAGALKYLKSAAGNKSEDKTTQDIIARLQSADVELLTASRTPDDPRGKSQGVWNRFCGTLKELESRYPPATIQADVYICPMHPNDRHLKPDDRCTVCGMPLVRRRLPASSVYQKPGDPTFKILATCRSLEIGRPATVLLNISKPDGSPVTTSDLLEMHTRKIHLLINDRSLSDYHHEHPVPTGTPGQYQFSFTPQAPGPYRLWADVVPAASGIQEYDLVDLPAQTPARPIQDREPRFNAVVHGRTYEVTFDTGGKSIHCGQTVIGALSIKGVDGKGFTQLEPVMGAFAHIVGFSEDGRTVLHIHPLGREPSGGEDRAGPVFAFKFYAPSAGFWRLYCQVQIGGVQEFAPFNINVEKEVDINH